jgi:sugar phosphate isomerase/epimerase
MPHPTRPRVRRTAAETLVIEREGVLVTEGMPIESLLPMPDVLDKGSEEPFRYCLNTSTVRGHKLPLPELVDIAAAAGYEAIEPWIDEIERYRDEGGDLGDLHRRIKDMGLTVESGIGFFEWIVDDEERRAAGLERARRDMDLISRIGGKRLAAPPWGAHQADAPKVDLHAAAERYRALLEVGERAGVVPLVEVWGFSKNLNRLCEAAFIAVDAGHPDASILADTYHLYKGGSPLSGLAVLQGDAFRVFHVNDYPSIAPEEITDADRVYPGDGIAPHTQVFLTLRDIGFNGVLSLELFNKEYYEQEPLTVARTGLEKLREQVQKALT